MKIVGAPKIRQIYWCEYPDDSIVPEFGKTRPVLIVSFKQVLKGHSCILPISTDDQEGKSREWAHPLSLELTLGRRSWVVCNHPTTISHERLSPFKNMPRLSEAEFNEIIAIMHKWLPQLPAPRNT